MLYTTLHNRILRLVLAVLGELIAAAALNLFIVPLSLYTGGLRASATWCERCCRTSWA